MLLDLPAFSVVETKTSGDDLCITVETSHVPDSCPKCRNLFGSFYSHGSRVQFFHDLPFHGKRVALKIHRKRYKCRDCGGTFEEPLADMHADHTMTTRLTQHIIKESYHDKFTDVARRVGVTEKTVRNVFREYVNELIASYKFNTPEILGIDEVNIQRMRCVITNLKDKTIIDMLPERKKEDVLPFLLKMDRRAVRLVSMDMWAPYRDACRIAFPQARIIVDRFHVQRLANNIMTRVRVDVMRNLTAAQRRGIKSDKYILQSRNFNLTEYQQELLLQWCQLVPILGEVYEKKERFMDIWELERRTEAEAAYDAWESGLTEELRPIFKEIISAFKNWRSEIFSWWNYRITNAFTESLNGKIRELHRSGRGYSFDVLRAKIISKTSLHKRAAIPQKFDKGAFYRFTFSSSFDDEYVNYGVDISTLLALEDLDSDR